MDEIMEIAKLHQLFVVEDNAQAIGCDFYHKDGRVSKTGTIGDIGCTSFFPSKNLGCYGDGGAMYTNNSELAVNLKKIANHGQVVKYHHEVVGCNSRLDTIQAAILNIKLPLLDSYCNARRKVADYYDIAFKDIPQLITPFRSDRSLHVFHQYTLKLEGGVDRDKMIEFLNDKGIPSMVYYPIPAHKQKMFASFGLEDQDLPITNELTMKVISLPIHTEMEEDQLEYICTQIKTFFNN